MAKEFYEVVYTALEGNVVERDVKHFTDEGEAIAFHNSLKDNDEIASAIIDRVYYDPESFLSGRTQTAYYANPIHKDYLNSRSGDKRFEEPEGISQFLKRKLKARKEFGTSLALNEMKKEVSYRVEYTTLDGEKAKSSIYNSKKEADKKEAKLVNSGIRKAKVVEIPLNEFDDKSMKDYGDAMKVALGSKEDRAQKRFDRLSKDDQTKLMKLKAMIDRERDMEESNLKGIREEDDEKGIREEDKPKGIREEDDEKGIREETSIEKIYMDMLKNELPSQGEVNDAFEKFEREAHYLNNKPVGEWDAMDMSNWKSILRKGGRVMETMISRGIDIDVKGDEILVNGDKLNKVTIAYVEGRDDVYRAYLRAGGNQINLDGGDSGLNEFMKAINYSYKREGIGFNDFMKKYGVKVESSEFDVS